MQQHLSLSDGLPQNSVRDIFKDKYGYLWLGTEGGMARWDGRNIRALTNQNYPEIITFGSAKIIGADEYGNMVIVPEGYPHAFYWQNGPLSFDLHSKGTDQYYCQDQYRMWNLNQLFHSPTLQARPDLVSKIKGLALVRGFSNDGLTGVFVHKDGFIWYDGENVSLDSLGMYNLRPYCLLGKYLFNIGADGSLIRFNQFRKPEKIDTGSLAVFLSGLPSAKRRNELKFFSFQGPPLLYDGNDIYTVTLNSDIPELHILATNFNYPDISSLVYDSSQNKLYVGTFTNGLYIYQKNNFRIIHQPFPDNCVEQYPEDIFYAIQPYSPNRILTTRGLLSTNDPRFYLPIENTRVFSIGKWKNHFILSEGYGENIVMTDSPFVKREKLFHAPLGIIQYQEESDSSMLMQTSGQLLRYTFSSHHLDTLVRNRISNAGFSNFLLLQNGDVLIGGVRYLEYYSQSSKKLIQIPAFNGVAVRLFYQDRQNRVWIGTKGSGFYCWDGRKIHHFPMDRKGNVSVINGFLEDKHGRLWITTNNGLFCYSGLDLERYMNGEANEIFYNYYDQTDGLPANEFNHAEPGIIYLHDSSVALSSMKGIVIFHPDSLRFRNTSEQLFVDRIIVDSTTLPAISAGATYNLPRASEYIEFDVSTPYSGNSLEIQTFYRLSGGSMTWQKIPDDGRIIFNRLSSGNYELEFKLIRSSSNSYSRIRLIIAPAWFETTTSKVVFFFLLLLLVILIVRISTSLLRKQKAKLESLVAERTSKLDDSITQLTGTIGQLRNSEEALHNSMLQREAFNSMVVHDLQSPLKYLSVVSGQLYEKISPIATPNIRELAYELTNATTRVSNFSNDYLNWLKNNMPDQEQKFERVDVKDKMQKIEQLFGEIAAQKNNLLTWSFPDNFIIFTIRPYFEIILRNLVDNSIKYTDNGVIEIIGREEGEWQYIIIRDTGAGLSASQLSQLQKQFNGDGPVSSDSLGMQIVHDLLLKCKGAISIAGEENKGLTITLSFSK